MKETKTYKKLKHWPTNNYPKWLIIHHTGGTDQNPLADTSHHTAAGVEAYHLSKGWDGIGYHFFIEKDGEIYKGRPEHRNGAHCRGKNTQSIGICLAGNFDATRPTEDQKHALGELLKDLKAKYSIPLSNIVPHRKFANKTCYGTKLTDNWAKDLVVEQAVGIDNFSTRDLLKEARTRSDFWRELARVFS